MQAFLFLWAWACWLGLVAAAVTIYGPSGRIQSQTISNTAAVPTSSADVESVDNTLVLTPPPIPVPPPPSQFHLVLQNSAQNVQNASIQQTGSFYGFSIEMSVVEQISASPVNILIL